MFLVIGSGPAGVACSAALLARGAQVTMVDGGVTLDGLRREALDRLRRLPPSRWTGADAAFVKEGTDASPAGIPLKLAYGSSYPYDDPVGQPITTVGAESKPSWARGGLSAVWGAAVLPYRDEDLRGWPISESDLAPHYRSILAMVPTSGREDAIAELFPLHTDRPAPPRSSSQASSLLGDVRRNGASARSAGMWIGASRLAMRSQPAAGDDGCVQCGLCMYGCPAGLIYNSTSTLEMLQSDPRFVYRTGLVVERLVEEAGHVRACARDVATGSNDDILADRVFVGAGVLGSTRLLLASLEAYGEHVTMKDSCYFLLPLVRYRSDRDAAIEPRHTLAQVFVELVDPAISPHTVHLQVYTHNELYRMAIAGVLGPLDQIFGGIVERVALSRLLLIQGYLHSDQSAEIDVTLDHPTSRAPALRLVGRDNPAMLPALGAVVAKLRAQRSILRALPAGPLLRVGKPGRGFHSGGTLPMRRHPGRLETDTMGRPGGTGRVHVIDASVFPSIPATTITLSVMANAHRIGTEAVA